MLLIANPLLATFLMLVFFSAADVSAMTGIPTVDSVPAGFDVCNVPATAVDSADAYVLAAARSWCLCC